MQLYRALLELLTSKPANTRGDGSVVFIQMQESGDNIWVLLPVIWTADDEMQRPLELSCRLERCHPK